MLPFKKILSPTDFSEPSSHALKVAQELALASNAEIILIHVVSPIPIVSSPGDMQGVDTAMVLEQMLAHAREAMDRMVGEMPGEKLSVRSLVFTGSPGDEIARAASEEAVDLIVIATHGFTGWRRFVFGSVTERVVRLAPCPVLTIPAPEAQSQS